MENFMIVQWILTAASCYSLSLSVHSIEDDANQSKDNASSGQDEEDSCQPWFH